MSNVFRRLLSKLSPSSDRNAVRVSSAVQQPPVDPAAESFDKVLAASGHALATIKYRADGSIENANQRFLELTGYTKDELLKQHHRSLVEHGHVMSAEYVRFWERLRNGIAQVGEFPRRRKDGSTLWIQASYVPVHNANGQVIGIACMAVDVTKPREVEQENAAILDAIERAQGAIEFTLDGTILRANKNFLALMGYHDYEVVGQHHRMFVDEEYAKSPAYAQFWQELRNGTFHAKKFLRFGKNGKKVWISANYNPIFDASGRVVKMIKFASDITKEVAHQELSRQVASSVSISVAEMAAASNEIAESVARTARLAQETELTSTQMIAQATDLDEGRKQIGDVIDLIERLAAQTNLLALNATIEAARAGSYGRSFSVVAGEVKLLANETASASGKIAQTVKELQCHISGVVDSTRQINKSMMAVSRNTNTIAAAVEQQSKTTELINETAAKLSSYVEA